MKYMEIGATRALPSVTFQTARQVPPARKAREEAKTHNGADYKRDAVM